MGGLYGQPCQRIFKAPAEPCVMPSPGNGSRNHPVLLAPDPFYGSFDVGHLRAYIQSSPPTLALSLVVVLALPMAQSTAALFNFRRAGLYHYRIGFGIRIDVLQDDFTGAHE